MAVAAAVIVRQRLPARRATTRRVGGLASSRGSWAWLLVGRSRWSPAAGCPPTESLVERFGLFTIIVLGEVVFGVVDGLSVGGARTS